MKDGLGEENGTDFPCLHPCMYKALEWLNCNLIQGSSDYHIVGPSLPLETTWGSKQHRDDIHTNTLLQWSSSWRNCTYVLASSITEANLLKHKVRADKAQSYIWRIIVFYAFVLSMWKVKAYRGVYKIYHGLYVSKKGNVGGRYMFQNLVFRQTMTRENPWIHFRKLKGWIPHT